MRIECNKQNDVAVLSIKGSLDVSVQTKLKEKLYGIADSEQPDMVVDFTEVTFIDSSCLGVLVALTKKLREKKGDIKLVNLSEDVRSIFQITRLDRVFEIYADNQQAIDSYFK